MKTKVLLAAVAVAFSFAVTSCGNKKAADSNVTEVDSCCAAKTDKCVTLLRLAVRVLTLLLVTVRNVRRLVIKLLVIRKKIARKLVIKSNSRLVLNCAIGKGIL